MPNSLFPDTNAYMVLGYVLVVVILGALVTYLVLKAQNLHAEIETLETLEREEAALTPEGIPAVSARDALNVG